MSNKFNASNEAINYVNNNLLTIINNIIGNNNIELLNRDNEISINNKIKHISNVFCYNPYGFINYNLNEVIISPFIGDVIKVTKKVTKDGVEYKYFINNKASDNDAVLKTIDGSIYHDSFYVAATKATGLKISNKEGLKLNLMRLINLINKKVNYEINLENMVIITPYKRLEYLAKRYSISYTPGSEGYYNKIKDEFFHSSLVEDVTNITPIKKLFMKGKTFIGGINGTDKKLALSLRRNIDEIKGVFDPCFSKEGEKCGLDRIICSGLKIDRHGFIIQKGEQYKKVSGLKSEMSRYIEFYLFNDAKRNLLAYNQMSQSLVVTTTKIAYGSYYGFTHEDGVVVTESLSKTLSYKGIPLQVGDKVAGLFGNKATVSKVVKDGELGEGVGIMFSLSCLLSRMNIGQLLETQDYNDSVIMRLDHNVVDKLKIYSDTKKSKVNGQFLEGLKIGIQEIQILKAHNAINIINEYLSRVGTESLDIYKKILRALGVKLEGSALKLTGRSDAAFINGAKKITNPHTPIYFDIDFEETVIADNGLYDLSNGEFGYIELPIDLHKDYGKYVLVLPTDLRPLTKDKEDQYIFGDLNNSLLTILEGIQENDNEKIKKGLNLYYGNDNEFMAKFNKRGLKQIAFGEDGLLREGLMTFQMSHVASSVITVDPTLSIDEIGLPGVVLNQLNIKEGDIIVATRAPQLHINSVMGMRVKKTDGLSFHLNPQVCKGFNADFDGDTMKIVKLFTKEAIEDATKMLPSKHCLDYGTDSIFPTPTKDSLMGIYAASTNDDLKPTLERILGVEVKEALNKKSLNKLLGDIYKTSSEEDFSKILKNLWDFGFKTADALSVLPFNIKSLSEFLNNLDRDGKLSTDINGNIFSLLYNSGASGKADQVLRIKLLYNNGKGINFDTYYKLSNKSLADGLYFGKMNVGLGGQVQKEFFSCLLDVDPNISRLLYEFSNAGYQGVLDAKHGGDTDALYNSVVRILNIVQGSNIYIPIYNDGDKKVTLTSIEVKDDKGELSHYSICLNGETFNVNPDEWKDNENKFKKYHINFDGKNNIILEKGVLVSHRAHFGTYDVQPKCYAFEVTSQEYIRVKGFNAFISYIRKELETLFVSMGADNIKSNVFDTVVSSLTNSYVINKGTPKEELKETFGTKSLVKNSLYSKKNVFNYLLGLKDPNDFKSLFNKNNNYSITDSMESTVARIIMRSPIEC